jgi:hypothetical protein
MHAHPPGPGFPKHDPSVKSATSFNVTGLLSPMDCELAASRGSLHSLDLGERSHHLAYVRFAESLQVGEGE